MSDSLHVVTGAFGYSGRWVTHLLLSEGKKVRTLTNALGRDDPFKGEVEVNKLDFNDYDSLVKSLKHADVLYNTYWVRYNKKYKQFAHDVAVKNTKILFEAAKDAGVKRIVHFSVSNPTKAPNWTYFEGKVKVEKMLKNSGISYSILRPTVLFGGERNVLINNIAWMIRKFPIFGTFGIGSYPIQPVHVEDVAKVAIEQGRSSKSTVIDVTGPETFTYSEYIQLIRDSMGLRRLIVPIPPIIAWAFGRALGLVLRDHVITMAEIKGLRQGLMASNAPSNGDKKFSEWITEHGSSFGKRYQNDLKERTYKI